ncbi:MAG: hypothetical protein U0800_05950 [Isosphaeraceae bacterium]
MARRTPGEAEARLRRVSYVRHEFHGPSRKRDASLLVFVYDASFDACGVFPPLHLLNELLLKGGSTGGMSPGTTWEPFSLSESEYEDLQIALRTVPPKSLRREARWPGVGFKFDPSFDHHRDYFAWMADVCDKYRDAHHEELRRAGLMG